MRRRIHVRSPLTNMGEDFTEKSFSQGAPPFLIPIGDFPLFIGESFPLWDARLERLGKIDKLFSGQELLDFQEVRFGCRQGAGRDEAESDDYPTAQNDFHSGLLNDR